MKVAVRFALAIGLSMLAACGDDDNNARPAATASPSNTITASPSRTSTPQPSATFTLAPTHTQLPSATLTNSPLPSATQTASSSPSATPTLSAPDRLRALAADETRSVSGLSGEVHVIRSEGNVPHIYASNRHDLAFVQGFVVARDRFFMMDLTRRLGLGRVTELIGDRALENDLESRLTGMTYVADRIAVGMSADQGEQADAFADGVNFYIDEVKARRLPIPSELRLAGPLLGVSNPRDLMEPFARRDVAGVLAVIVYQSSYETGDVGNTSAHATLDTLFNGAALESLRKAGAHIDLPRGILPYNKVASTAGFGIERGDTFVQGPTPDQVPGAQTDSPVARRNKTGRHLPPAEMLSQLAANLDGIKQRLGRVDGFGSNAWAVAGAKTPSGATLVAGDGHLQLDIPSIFFQIGLDDSVLGNGTTHQLGLVIPGFFIMPVGTNGHVAWSQTQLSADITDWYQEELQLDDSGLPASTLFHGEQRPLRRVDETFVIRDVAALGSKGRTETHPRFVLFDGRFLAQIEGRATTPDAPLGPHESAVYTLNGLVVPGDTDGDGVISGVSFDYTALDMGQVLAGADGFGHSSDVEEFRQNARKLVGYSQNIVAGDDHGGILYTAYHAVPCRGYLPRQSNGDYIEGADPTMLLDGTQYGGFEVPMTNGLPDESASGGDPQRCLVPFDSTPQSITPARGYVLTANNDPGGFSFDGSLNNDPWHIGGPWESGFRASRIMRELARTVADNDGDVARMAAIQGNHQSGLGEVFVPYFLEAIRHARNLQAVDRLLTPWEQRLVTLYQSDPTAIDEVEQRLNGWAQRGFLAASGVQTFYHTLADNETDDATATMIFHPWMSRFLHAVWDDEGIDGGLFAEGDHTRVSLLGRFLAARDAGDSTTFASYNPDTGESVFFDRLGTDQVETSRELMMQALLDTLQFLRSAPLAADRGGFGTSDMGHWLWGLRHQVRFESLLAPFLGNDPQFAIFTQPFNIDTTKLPLAPSLPTGDPRIGLRWFPRPGDQWGVDGPNPGFSGTDFTYGSGPVMRMVFALRDGEVSGLNIIPGGQSGLTDSPHFSDQAALWLGNQAYTLRFKLDDVLAGSMGHEVYQPTTN
ncbi:MAG TPA: penicillin acylase family protein [Candidatus Acidoferrales bacterium]|nr:penicillin acylase family protein [Candidatus Acidoferrales bacterium]